MLDPGLGTGDGNNHVDKLLPPELLMLVIGRQVTNKQNWLTIHTGKISIQVFIDSSHRIYFSKLVRTDENAVSSGH